LITEVYFLGDTPPFAFIIDNLLYLEPTEESEAGIYEVFVKV